MTGPRSWWRTSSARIRERRTLMAATEARAFLHRGLRAAALIADGDHFAGVVLTETARRRSPRIARRVRVFSVLRPLPDLVAELNDFQPTVLYGYPSAMLQLAAEQKAGRLRIHPILAVASGETLAAHGAAEIEAALGCRVTVRYLASEALALTSRCRQGLFHVNADWYIVEPVDDELPARPGRRTLPHGAGHQPGQPGPAPHPVQPGRPGAAGCRPVRLRQPVSRAAGRGPQRRRAELRCRRRGRCAWTGQVWTGLW